MPGVKNRGLVPVAPSGKDKAVKPNRGFADRSNVGGKGKPTN